MKKILLLFVVFPWMSLFAQQTDTISLLYCQQLALDNYPLIRQKELLSEAAGLKIKNLSTNYFPQIALNGQATYQSAVTEIPQISPMFDFPSMSKNQKPQYELFSANRAERTSYLSVGGYRNSSDQPYV